MGNSESKQNDIPPQIITSFNNFKSQPNFPLKEWLVPFGDSVTEWSKAANGLTCLDLTTLGKFTTNLKGKSLEKLCRDLALISLKSSLVHPTLIDALLFYSSRIDEFHEFSSQQNLSVKAPDISDVYEYFPRNIYLQRLATLAFHHVFLSIDPAISLPKLSEPSSLLSKEAVFMIDSAIAPEERSLKWQNLFSLKKHGQSWTVFHDAIQLKGSIVIVIKEKAGMTFD